MKRKAYEAELRKLQIELAKLQETVQRTGMKVAILFEGRDAAGKGGMIKTIADRMNPRVVRIVALPKPSDIERTQWYFQRYAAHLPGAGQIVLFDRSWYNRAGVERVMGFCTDEEYETFLKDAPIFERMLQDADVVLLKYWIHVSDEEQERRFQSRATNPEKRWKLSPLDLEARTRWVDYARARDAMFAATDLPDSPWRVLNGDDKRVARLNCIRNILSEVPYEYNEEAFRPIELPERQKSEGFGYRPLKDLNCVPDHYRDD